MTSLGFKAHEIIDEIMERGSDKDGKSNAWRFKPPSYHMIKAANHLWVAMAMYAKIMKEDDEGPLLHFKHAGVRVWMIVCILEAR